MQAFFSDLWELQKSKVGCILLASCCRCSSFLLHVAFCLWQENTDVLFESVPSPQYLCCLVFATFGSDALSSRGGLALFYTIHLLTFPLQKRLTLTSPILPILYVLILVITIFICSVYIKNLMYNKLLSIGTYIDQKIWLVGVWNRWNIFKLRRKKIPYGVFNQNQERSV